MTVSSCRLILLVAVCASAFTLSACEAEVSVGERTVNRDQLELEAIRLLEAETGQKPASVECPEDLKAEVEAAETCELVDQSGNHYDMEITITSVDDDGNAKFNIQVGDIKQMGDVPE